MTAAPAQPDLARLPLTGAGRDWASRLGPALTGLAAAVIAAIFLLLLGHLFWLGVPGLSWRFLTGGSGVEMFDLQQAGLLPMVFGTAARVLLMTLFVLPVGVITAIYLTEYARAGSAFTRVIRSAVNNLAGVPSIIFGLFGLGFFIQVVGGAMDRVLAPEHAAAVWRKPSLFWAAATMAVMTLPVVIVATEEALRAIPRGVREASLALGATRLQTLGRLLLPHAMPGILAGALLAISRAAGEVAPLLFTGAAYYMATLPGSLSDQFLDLGYHVFILATQSHNVDEARPLLYATVVVLLLLTFTLNVLALIIRARMRRRWQVFQEPVS
jgi:phosphate transport system permease protein